jgi:excisionase family DNA binding protein
MEDHERLTFSVEEAAEKLGISKSLGYQLAKAGQLPGAIKLGQKRVVVSKVQLERFLEGRAQEEVEACR